MPETFGESPKDRHVDMFRLVELAQGRGLPGARLADDVGVVAGISQVEAKRLLAAPDMPHADVKIVFVHGCVHAAQASRRSRKEHE